MNVMDAILTRRSIRAYHDRAIEPEKLARVLEAGRQAPSASNRQPWQIVVVKDPGKRRQLAEAANKQAFVGQAPVVLVGCAVNTERVMSCGHPAHLIDVSICLTTMSLAAMGEGLGTCWIGAFNQQKVKEVLGLPESTTVVQLMPLGYPTTQPDARERKPMGEFAAFV